MWDQLEVGRHAASQDLFERKFRIHVPSAAKALNHNPNAWCREICCDFISRPETCHTKNPSLQVNNQNQNLTRNSNWSVFGQALGVPKIEKFAAGLAVQSRGTQVAGDKRDVTHRCCRKPWGPAMSHFCYTVQMIFFPIFCDSFRLYGTKISIGLCKVIRIRNNSLFWFSRFAAACGRVGIWAQKASAWRRLKVAKHTKFIQPQMESVPVLRCLFSWNLGEAPCCPSARNRRAGHALHGSSWVVAAHLMLLEKVPFYDYIRNFFCYPLKWCPNICCFGSTHKDEALRFFCLQIGRDWMEFFTILVWATVILRLVMYLVDFGCSMSFRDCVASTVSHHVLSNIFQARSHICTYLAQQCILIERPPSPVKIQLYA